MVDMITPSFKAGFRDLNYRTSEVRNDERLRDFERQYSDRLVRWCMVPCDSNVERLFCEIPDSSNVVRHEAGAYRSRALSELWLVGSWKAGLIP